MFPGTLFKPVFEQIVSFSSYEDVSGNSIETERKKKLNIFQISDFKSKQNSNKIAEKMGSNPNS